MIDKIGCASTALLLLTALSSSASSAEKIEREVVSPTYTIDRIYRSMEGPQSTQSVVLLPNEPPELVWITGFKTDMVGDDGTSPSKPEFMCHVNLDLDVAGHQRRFGQSSMTSRILTLSQGQVDVKFPPGFGLPVLSNEPLSMTTQVLNHNLTEVNMKVRHKVTFNFVRDRDLKKPMNAMFNRSPFVMSLLEGQSGHFGRLEDSAALGESCLPGEQAANAGGGSVYTDQFAQKFSGHWTVKPGREVRHTNVTQWLNLPYDTTVHHIAVHLHPFAESLELKDLTAGKTIFKSRARNPKTGIGLKHVDSYSSAKGKALFKDHQYALISTYNNPTSTNTDSMAVMLMFLRDKNFKKPTSIHSGDAKTTVPPVVRPKAVLHTTLGKITIRFHPEAAPRSVGQLMRLMRAGVYDRTRVYSVVPNYLVQFGGAYDRTIPLTPEQQGLLRRLPLEASGQLKHRRGTLTLARQQNDLDSAESSFSILLSDAYHLDGQFTAFAEVEEGMSVVEAMAGVALKEGGAPRQPIEIIRVERVPATAVPLSLKVSTAPAAPPILSTERLRMKTSLGEMTFRFYPGVAPQTARQILLLAKAGAYEGTSFFRVEPGFVAQLSTVKVPANKIPAEFLASLKHRRGVLSLARPDNDIHGGQSSFSILLGDAPHLDQKYTIFGELESGQQVLEAIEKAPRTGTAPNKRIDVLKMTVETIDPESDHGAQSCLPGETMSTATMAVSPADSNDPTVMATNKPVIAHQGRLPNGERFKSVLFKGLKVDKIYPSMKGPWTRAYIALDPENKSPNIWITGYKAEVLDGHDGKASQEFMCHTKLDMVNAHGTPSAFQNVESFFVISQGQDEIRFPEGFALRIPDPATRQIDINAMVLNNNYPGIRRDLNFKATITFLDETEAQRKKIIPLRLFSASVYCPTDASVARPGEAVCLPAETDPRMLTGQRAGHWLVPPGSHTYRTSFTPTLAQDSHIHYIMGHLHPYAESFELRDLATGKSVWQGKVENDPNPMTALLKRTEYYRSTKGLPIVKGHTYEFVVTYNNPTPNPIDAMASLWIYVRDKS